MTASYKVAIVLLFAMQMGGASGADSDRAYPYRPIRILVPFAPGGSTDLVARGIGEKLTKAWGQQVVIDNRTGADGIIASEIVANATRDGYTLLMNALGHAANPSLYRKLPYDTLKDFTPIILGADVPIMLVVHSSVKANNVSELLALARAKPGGLNCGTAGVGASHHLAAEVFRLATKIDLQYIHYKGAAPALLEVAAGRVDMMFAPVSSAIQHVKAGRLKALGVTSPKRVAIVPDLPTIAESGVPGYEARAWYGLVGPAKLDKGLTRKLNREIDHALRKTDLGDRLLAIGAVPMGGTPEEFGEFIQREVKKYAVVVKAAGISPQ